MKLTIQIVNFKSRHYLRECLFSIRENLPAGAETEIIIVNNDENPLDIAGAEFGNGISAKIIELKKNIGFGAAQNAGARQARGEYLLFLNPDTKILAGALQAHLESFARDDRVGIAGSLLLDSAGRIQDNCFGRERSPFSTILGKISVKDKTLKDISAGIFESDWVSGGAMMIRKEVFEKTGGFDENYFMYFEDVDLCRRAKKIGWKIVINPKARIFHESGKSFESEREKKMHYYASQDYYFRKHFGSVGAGMVKLLRLPYFVKNVYLKRR